MNGIVIVGAGQAGATLAETLRAKGFEGALTLIGAETGDALQRCRECPIADDDPAFVDAVVDDRT